MDWILLVIPVTIFFVFRAAWKSLTPRNVARQFNGGK